MARRLRERQSTQNGKIANIYSFARFETTRGTQIVNLPGSATPCAQTVVASEEKILPIKPLHVPVHTR